MSIADRALSAIKTVENLRDEIDTQNARVRAREQEILDLWDKNARLQERLKEVTAKNMALMDLRDKLSSQLEDLRKWQGTPCRPKVQAVWRDATGRGARTFLAVIDVQRNQDGDYLVQVAG